MENIFSHFINSCNLFLDFLVQKHSFSKSQPRITPPECSIDFHKGSVIFSVIYEYGDFPWIRITSNGKDYSLDNIIKKKLPQYIIDRKKPSLSANEKVDFVLKKYSKVLQEHLGLFPMTSLTR
mgnify:CR=1 FL=1